MLSEESKEGITSPNFKHRARYEVPAQSHQFPKWQGWDQSKGPLVPVLRRFHGTESLCHSLSRSRGLGMLCNGLMVFGSQ